MKKTTIIKIISRKLDDWISQIKKDIEKDIKLKERYSKLPEEIHRDLIVTGGCIVSLLDNQEPNDYDIYFKTVETAKKVAEFYTKGTLAEIKSTENSVSIMIPSSGIIKKDINKKRQSKYRVVSITDNAITLSDGIQIVIRFVGSPEEIHKNFDFVHTKNLYTDNKLLLNGYALESILTKELKYVGSLYPVSSIFRMKKFVARGWKINAGEILKMIWDCNNLDLNDINVLREQLIGVDTSYFEQLITALKGTEITENINRDYLFRLIDEIFNESLKSEIIETEKVGLGLLQNL